MGVILSNATKEYIKNESMINVDFSINDNIVMSLEYLVNFNLGSGLVIDLIDMYNELINNYRKFTDTATNHDLYKYWKAFVNKYQKYYSDKFKKITKKHLGVTIDLMLDPYDIGAYFTTKNNNVDFPKLEELSEFLSFGKVEDLDPDQFLIIEDSFKYDFQLNKFLQSPYIEKMKPVVILGLPLIDLEKLYRLKNNSLTSEELTAITLHEIGHLIFIATGSILGGYTGLNISMFNLELLQNIKNVQDDPAKVLMFLKKLLSNLNKLKDKVKSSNDEIVITLLDKANAFVNNKLVMNVVENPNEYHPTVISKIKMSLLSFIVKILAIVITYLVVGISIWFPVVLLSLKYLGFFKSIEEIVEVAIMNQEMKKQQQENSTASTEGMYDLYNTRSRQIITQQQYYSNERFADEFVTKYGLSKSLATGLAKMYGVVDSNGSIKDNNQIKDILNTKNTMTSVSHLINYIDGLSNTFNLKYGLDAIIYEQILDRLYRIQQNNRSLLKLETLKDYQKRLIVQQNDTIDRLIKKFKKIYPDIKYKTKLFSKILKFLGNFSPSQGLNLSSPEAKVYTQLYNDLDEIINNVLFETSYKLQAMVIKKLKNKR